MRAPSPPPTPNSSSHRYLDLNGVSLHWLDGGGFRHDGGAIFGPVPRPRWLDLYPPADDNTVPLTAHVVLVHDGATYGLLESGFGRYLTERQRRHYSLERESQLERGLAEFGLSPSRVDWIVLSHLHLDTAGGVMSPAGPVFPNAAIYVQRLELAEAHDQTNRGHNVYVGDSLDRLQALSLLQPVDGAADVTPSVSVALTGGHSRGHQATLVRGAVGAAFLYLGDLLVTHAHLPPTWVSALDDFPLDTVRAKREWLGRAAHEGWWIAFSHDVTAAAGRFGADGKLTEVRRLPT